MIIYKNKAYYSPREIARDKLITNSKNKGDYRLILRLIKAGKLEAINIGMGKTVYNMVSEESINKFNEERFYNV